MGSLVDDKTLNSLNNQISGGSRSSLLLSHVEFKTVDNDDDDMMSAKSLQTKYNVLTNDNKFGFNATNNEPIVKLNGQTKCQMNAAINNIVNGNSGENADGIPVPKHVLFPHERVLLDWKEYRSIGAGLVNLGNTCFLNSVLQCLSYCPPLVNYLLHSNDHNPNKCNVNANLFCTVCEMTRHVRHVRSHNGDSIKPLGICRRLKSIAKHFQFGRQEDAHEFLRYLIDHMWKSCLANSELTHQKLDPLSKETTAINQIFGGYHRSQVLCLQCKAKSNTYDYFMDFMLDIKNVNSLEKALDKFVAPEILQHDDSYKCTRCKRKVLARKQFTVFKAPNVATFQFKRFDYNRMFGGKITKQISYPEKLDLRPYMSDKGPPIIYKLNSVLVHLGPTCNSGHYFCYVRNSNGMWYLMDDARVIQSNLHNALNQGQAYVLFYVRLESDFHKPTPIKNFISQSNVNGINLNLNLSSPELMARNQKLNSFNSPTKIMVNATQPVVKRLNQSKDFVKPNQTDVTKLVEKTDRKPNPSESNGRQTKCLVPYTSDSSDDDSSKQTNHNHNHMNGSLNANCDKSHNETNSSKENNSNPSETVSADVPKEVKVENCSPKVRLNSNQNIPNTPKPKTSRQSQPIAKHTSDSTSCPPLAPITLKVKATTSSWQVVETGLMSPSIASNSSTNSVNSTTEWTVSDGKPDLNGKHHSKHKHKNKNRCLTANGNVTQLMSTNDKLPQSDERNSRPNEETNSRSNDISAQKLLKPKPHNQLDNDFSTSVVSNHNRETDSQLPNRNNCQKCEHSDAKSISSRRSSSDSTRDEKRRSNERDRSHSKSTNSDDERESYKGHKLEKKKRKRDSADSPKYDAKDCETSDQKLLDKIKHKKKKKKNKKHKKRERSLSESEESDDGLQWVERTKETVERERNTETNNTYVKQWDENVRDLAKKRSSDEMRETNGYSSHPNGQKLNDTDNNSIVSELVKNGIRTFGDKVNAWNGGPSHIDRGLNDDKHRNESVDEYDEEYDKGKTKKVKTSHRSDKFVDCDQNPFQKFQSYKQKMNGNIDSHHLKHNFIGHFKDRQNHNKLFKKSYHGRHDRERRH